MPAGYAFEDASLIESLKMPFSIRNGLEFRYIELNSANTIIFTDDAIVVPTYIHPYNFIYIGKNV